MPWLDQAILHLGGLAGLQADGPAVGPVRRFLGLGRSLERALCVVRMLDAGLGGVTKPGEGLIETLVACRDGSPTYRQRYPRAPQAGPAAELLLADEANPRSVAFQLAGFHEELGHLPPGGTLLLPACRKAVLRALTQARLFEAEANGGILSPAGNEGFEHLLRSLGLAARYVSGYIETSPKSGKPKLIGADATHAWVSLFVPEAGWIDYDPTNLLMPGPQHITLAWGRDFSDVSPLRGVLYGGGSQKLEVEVDVIREG